ncbi:MAG: DUF4358 domain-containing protein [Tenericutes bacterium]|nr:DUF4358 domain-containing protein [Mycoplasmatota bacterium]
MKKILIAVICLLFLSGCGVSKKKLDLNDVGNKLSSSKYFTNHEIINSDVVLNRYSIDTSKFEELMMLSSTKYDDATMVFIAYPNNAETKKEFETFIDSYNSQWVGMNYFPEQKQLVENGLYTDYNNYLVYIVSEDNNRVLNIIKG